MPQQIGDFLDGCPRPLQASRRGMPQGMRIAKQLAHIAANKGAIHRITDGRYAQRLVEGGSVPHKQGTVRCLWTCFKQILHDGLTGGHRERQLLHALALVAANGQRGATPVHRVQC